MPLARAVLAVGIFLTVYSVGAYAEELGKVQLNGRTIVIDDNGTWRYEETPAVQADWCADGQPFVSKKLDFSFCVHAPWYMDVDANPLFEVQIHNRERDLLAAVVTERSILPTVAVEYAILANAAKAVGVRADDIPVRKRAKREINGMEWSYIEYDVDFKGAKFRFGNHFASLGDAGVVQFMFWCSTPYFEGNRPHMEAVANTMRASTKILQ